MCLKIGFSNRRSGFHTCSVATLREDGRPTVRTVVLRGFREEARELVFHTDMRSGKAAEILKNPAIAMLFYDPEQKIQIRLDCHARIDSRNDTSLASWQKSRAMSRVCYAQAAAPGTMLNGATAMGPQLLDDLAYENFAVVSARIEALDWLYLAVQGHRRAYFTWGEGEPAQTWLAP